MPAAAAANAQERIKELEFQLAHTQQALRKTVDLRIEDGKARSQANQANPLEAALFAAIDAARAAETHSGDRIRFTSEDIRALAITLYIELSKRGKGGN